MIDGDAMKVARVWIGITSELLRPRDDNRPCVPGFVYIIEDAPRNLVKIGKTRDLGRRLLELRRQYDTDTFRFLHAWMTDDPDWLESYMHAKFTHQRKSGEWFAWDVLLELPTDCAVIWCRDPCQEPKSYEARYPWTAYEGTGTDD